MPSAKDRTDRTTLPLAGLRVLDLSRVLAGPVCCQVLADLGADVVKVERPGMGDDTRAWGPPFLPAAAGEARPPSAYYLAANRGKRSLAVDLARPEARDLLAGLVRQADVLVENFLPDSLEKLGLTPERLQAINPRLVSVSISGYGRTGPLAATPGYDLVIQATAGIMSITGEPAGMPMKIGVAITDVLTGLYAAISALAGLHARGGSRERGAPPEGEAPGGLAFDLALADCTLASLVNVVQGALVTGQRPQRYGNAHPHIVPYEAFATRDGHLVLAVGNDRQWQRFCAAAGAAELAGDPNYATNPDRVRHRGALIPALQTLLAARSTADWVELLTAAEVPHAPVQALDEILAAPQVAAREMVLETTDSAGRTYRVVGSPIHWDRAPPRTASPPPALGEHTDEVLRDWLNLDPAALAALRQAQVIA